jgi:hypothetical protein
MPRADDEVTDVAGVRERFREHTGPILMHVNRASVPHLDPTFV